MRTKRSTKALAMGVLALALTVSAGGIGSGNVHAASSDTKVSSSAVESQHGGKNKHARLEVLQSKLISFLNMDSKAFEEKQKTESLKEIAAGQGISAGSLKAEVVSLLQQRQTSAPSTKAQSEAELSDLADQVMVAKGPELFEVFKHKEGGHLERIQNSKELADLLGITTQELKKELSSGKTLGQLASEHHIDQQKVIDIEVARLNKHLEDRLDAGEITVDEYNIDKAKQTTLATTMLNEPMNQEHSGKGHHRGGGRFQSSASVASLLGLTQDELRKELKSGKNLAAVAAEHKVDVQQVIDLIVKERTAHLEQERQAGTWTDAQYKERVAALPDQVNRWVHRQKNINKQ